jgi:hypothetical protein
MEYPSIFQIVFLELNWDDDVSVRRVLQPSYELLEDAMALAEFDASRCGDDYGYDDVRECWWACDDQGRKYRFVIEQISPAPGQNLTAIRRHPADSRSTTWSGISSTSPKVVRQRNHELRHLPRVLHSS